MKISPSISVVVASHRPRLLPDLLEALRHQTFPSSRFEVILVTDYPNSFLQKQYAEYLWIYIPDRSISRKRNTGTHLAGGSIIAFIDDDCIPASDWLEQGYDFLEKYPDATAVVGQTSIEQSGEVSHTATREYRRLEKQGFRTNNLFFRTKQFRQIGGFDERFTVQREDIDLGFTALRHGMRMEFSDAIRVTHRFRHWEKWDLLKNCWNRRFDPLLFRKHPDMYIKNAGLPIPPTLGVVLLLYMLSFFGVLSGKRKGAAAVAGVNSLLVLSLGARRSGLRPFSSSRFFHEVLQVAVAPFVIIGALVYGWVVISQQPR